MAGKKKKAAKKKKLSQKKLVEQHVRKRSDISTVPLELIIDIDTAEKLSIDEVRYVVETYYDIQQVRNQNGNRAKRLEREGLPAELMGVLTAGMEDVEKHIRKVMKKWALARPLGEWAMQIVGIGPVISAGLMAWLAQSTGRHPSSFWRYAGLMPGQRRQRNKKLDYNPKLKTLCWKIGSSLVMQSNNPDSLYGRLYRERKAYETAKNEAGDYSDQAEKSLAEKSWKRNTSAKEKLLAGRLPDGHIDERCRRYAYKILVAHFWMANFAIEHPGERIPQPWVLEHGGHVDFIEPEVPFPTP